MTRLKVLYLPPPLHMRQPWESDVIAVVGKRHDLSIYDPGRPLEAQFRDVEIVIDHGGSMGTRPMADAANSVKLWQVLGNGIDHFELEYWRAKGIQVANCPGELTGVPLAELVFMFMLQLSRGWHEAERNLRSDIMYVPFGMELEGKTLGLVGFGAVARQVALRAQAFGMRVNAIDVRQVSDAEKAKFGVSWVRSPEHLDELLAQSDFVSLNLHLAPDTRHILDGRRLSLMKRGAFLINVSRADLVDEEALISALRAGRIGGVGLDVFGKEPPGRDHPLLAMPNVIATPHLAGHTGGTSKRRAAFAAENIDRIARGETPLALIDKRDNISHFSDHSETLRRLNVQLAGCNG
jgi:phosphoglycerate dehydrogenase-like enzyme